MGDVGVVAGILDDAGGRRPVARRSWWRGRRPGAARAAGSPPPDREIPRSAAPDRQPWRRRRRRCRWSSHSGAGRSWSAMPPAIVRRKGAVTAGGAAHDRAGPDHRRAALGRRQDHGDAVAAGGASGAAGLPCRRPRSGPIISTRAFTRRRPAGQASISTAGRCRRPCSTRWWAGRPADLLVIEGAMGLFDGIPAGAAPERRLGRPRRPLRPAGDAGDRRRRAIAIGGGG